MNSTIRKNIKNRNHLPRAKPRNNKQKPYHNKVKSIHSTVKHVRKHRSIPLDRKNLDNSVQIDDNFTNSSYSNSVPFVPTPTISSKMTQINHFSPNFTSMNGFLQQHIPIISSVRRFYHNPTVNHNNNNSSTTPATNHDNNNPSTTTATNHDNNNPTNNSSTTKHDDQTSRQQHDDIAHTHRSPPPPRVITMQFEFSNKNHPKVISILQQANLPIPSTMILDTNDINSDDGVDYDHHDNNHNNTNNDNTNTDTSLSNSTSSTFNPITNPMRVTAASKLITIAKQQNNNILTLPIIDTISGLIGLSTTDLLEIASKHVIDNDGLDTNDDISDINTVIHHNQHPSTSPSSHFSSSSHSQLQSNHSDLSQSSQSGLNISPDIISQTQQQQQQQRNNVISINDIKPDDSIIRDKGDHIIYHPPDINALDGIYRPDHYVLSPDAVEKSLKNAKRIDVFNNIYGNNHHHYHDNDKTNHNDSNNAMIFDAQHHVDSSSFPRQYGTTLFGSYDSQGRLHSSDVVGDMPKGGGDDVVGVGDGGGGGEIEKKYQKNKNSPKTTKSSTDDQYGANPTIKKMSFSDQTTETETKSNDYSNIHDDSINSDEILAKIKADGAKLLQGSFYNHNILMNNHTRIDSTGDVLSPDQVIPSNLPFYQHKSILDPEPIVNNDGCGDDNTMVDAGVGGVKVDGDDDDGLCVSDLNNNNNDNNTNREKKVVNRKKNDDRDDDHNNNNSNNNNNNTKPQDETIPDGDTIIHPVEWHELQRKLNKEGLELQTQPQEQLIPKKVKVRVRVGLMERPDGDDGGDGNGIIH